MHDRPLVSRAPPAIVSSRGALRNAGENEDCRPIPILSVGIACACQWSGRSRSSSSRALPLKSYLRGMTRYNELRGDIILAPSVAPEKLPLLKSDCDEQARRSLNRYRPLP